MKKHALIGSLLLLAFLSPSMADNDRKFTPFEYHGSVTRITPEGKIVKRVSRAGYTRRHQLPRATPDEKILDRAKKRNDPAWPVAPLISAYNKAESPSAGASSRQTGLSRWLSGFCPWIAPRSEAIGE